MLAVQIFSSEYAKFIGKKINHQKLNQLNYLLSLKNFLN